MHNDLNYIEDLIVKFQTGIISQQELAELTEWYNSYSDEEVTIVTDEPLQKEQVRERMLNGILTKIRIDQPAVKTNVYRMQAKFWAASVAVLLILSLLAWFGIKRNKHVKSPDFAVQSSSDTILPGGPRAVLLLADGQKVVLDTAQDGIVVDGAIHYADGRSLASNVDLNKMSDLQLYVPKGGVYHITLSDGTQVWLNSDSRLRYPAKFASTEREVALDGEAFFMVKGQFSTKGQRIPFFVKTQRQTVEVLGTQFNVNGYSTQAFAKTTLLEGKVNIHVADQRIILKPGQQASTRGNLTKIKTVDAQTEIAWKEGKFNFDGKSFEETMAEIGRWYDLTIKYNGKIPNVELVGDAYRNEKINLVLRLLDAADVRYQLDIHKRELIIY
ncbi:transmembrane sensor [Sphingobacterium zeae]|uniref:Transmembrane sensor n=1 Tax=Sphingobacterium zeae TaxID=1776859 RepID=A0ABU0U8F9_9SPHI|nr:FecR family protein [Sphingobacterium zeae]MDQ1151247.1 transmembrane sensor [Sphingobacterium zeae]